MKLYNKIYKRKDAKNYKKMCRNFTKGRDIIKMNGEQIKCNKANTRKKKEEGNTKVGKLQEYR